MKITYIGLIILLSGISINTKGQNTNHHLYLISSERLPSYTRIKKGHMPLLTTTRLQKR